MRPAVYDVRCMMCGADMGQIAGESFRPPVGAPPPLPRRGGLPRCSLCGGSLYLDPSDPSLFRPTAEQAARLERAIA